LLIWSWAERKRAAAGAQARVVLGPVGHPVVLLRNVMAASGIRLERQERCPCMVEGARPGLALSEATQAGDQCNKVSMRGKPYSPAARIFANSSTPFAPQPFTSGGTSGRKCS
jgi:hypothetical protein